MTTIYITYTNNTAEAKNIAVTAFALIAAKVAFNNKDVVEVRVLDKHFTEIAYYKK